MCNVMSFSIYSLVSVMSCIQPTQRLMSCHSCQHTQAGLAPHPALPAHTSKAYVQSWVLYWLETYKVLQNDPKAQNISSSQENTNIKKKTKEENLACNMTRLLSTCDYNMCTAGSSFHDAFVTTAQLTHGQHQHLYITRQHLQCPASYWKCSACL